MKDIMLKMELDRMNKEIISFGEMLTAIIGKDAEDEEVEKAFCMMYSNFVDLRVTLRGLGYKF